MLNGTRVHVFSGDLRDDLGEGVVIGEVEVVAGITSPEIKLDSGDTVYGYQCWWKECEEVNDADKTKV